MGRIVALYTLILMFLDRRCEDSSELNGNELLPYFMYS